MAERFQPILQQTSASPFIAPGVSDNSAATLIAGLGKIGIEAYTGYQEAGLEKDIETTTQDYFTNQRQYEEGQQAGIDAGGLSKGIDSFWDKAATEVADTKDLSLLETQFKGKMETYASAMKQGKMTADQLYARIINTTREHVSRNPWLQKELLKTADDYLEITGLGGYIKTAQKSAKEQQDMQQAVLKDEMLRSSRNGVDPFSVPDWRERLQEREAGKAKFEAMEQGLKYVKNMLPEDAANFLKGKGRVAYQEVWGRIQDTIVAQMNATGADGKPLPWEVQKARIRMTAEQERNGLFNLVAEANPQLLSEPNVKEFLEHYSTSIKELSSTLEEYGSGKSAMEYAQTKFNTIRAVQEAKAAEVASAPALAMAAKVTEGWSDATKNRFIKDRPDIYNRQVATLGQLFDGTVSPLVANNGAQAIAGIVDAGQKTPIPVELGKAITTMAATIKDPKSFPDLKTKINTQAQLVSQMANVAAKDQFAGMSPTDRATATTVVAEYMDSAKALVEKNIKNLAEEGVLIGWGQLADGTLSLQYQEGSARNDAKLAELNAIYPGHLNNAIKAYSHLAGRTDYDKVFKDYFLGGDPALQGKEKAWEARTPDEAFTLFEAGTIDEPTYMAIIKDMKGKPRATTTPDKSIPEVTSKSLLGTEIPPGMNKGASGQITPSATPLPAATPVEPIKAPIKAPAPKKESPGAQYGSPLKEKPTVKGKPPVEKPTVTREHIKQAEQEIVGSSLTQAPLKHAANQEAIMKRASELASGKKDVLYVSQDKDRILASPKGKWVVYSEGKGKVRMYSPIEKVYVDIPYSDIPLFEKAFKLPKDSWKKWEK